MTKDTAIHNLYVLKLRSRDASDKKALDIAIKALQEETLDKSAMMLEIYMEGVNMTGEYQGSWVRFKIIEKIIDKYIPGKDTEK